MTNKNRQQSDQARRFRAMAAKIREHHLNRYKGKPMSYSQVAYAMRCADCRVHDDRSVKDWIITMIEPPTSYEPNGDPVLIPLSPIANKKQLLKVKYKVEHYVVKHIETVARVAHLEEL